jgi:putative AdoMet-dependent methyltransferase
MKKWYYDEKQIGMDYLDPKIAEEYDAQHQKFRNFKDEAKEIVKRLEITPEDVVLDFGCGTGGIALNLADHCKKVICVDISNVMLDILKDKAKKEKIENIETHCAGFLTYNHEDGKVDKIVSIAALHHLPDFWKSVALLKMNDILKPGGKLYIFDVIFTFAPKNHENIIKNMVENMRNVAGDSMADEAVIHIKDEFSTYDWIMEGLFEKTGFSIDSKKIESENYISYICSKL